MFIIVALKFFYKDFVQTIKVLNKKRKKNK